MNPNVTDALVPYVEVLSESADRTHRAEDRPQYQRHLAAAARMFVACCQDTTLEPLRKLVADERHSFGWAYLSDAEGERADRAFDEFAKRIDTWEHTV